MEEKFEDRRQPQKFAFCSHYREKELATRENVVMQNLEMSISSKSLEEN